MELQAIKKVIDLYIDGVHTGNTDMLRKAFHPKAMMYGTSSNNVTIVEIEGLYNFIQANPPLSESGETHECFITGIRYDGYAAFVEMVEEAAFGFNYTNYFQLLKIDNEWMIVSKSYNATPCKAS